MSGPMSYGGEIGKRLNNTEELLAAKVIEFQPMPCALPELSSREIKELKFSSDQKCFYDWLIGLRKGQQAFIDDPGLQLRSPGPVNHSRWLTGANRVIRLWISEPEPSKELMRLMEFITLVYAPMWFYTKRHSDFTESAQVGIAGVTVLFYNAILEPN